MYNGFLNDWPSSKYGEGKGLSFDLIHFDKLADFMLNKNQAAAVSDGWAEGQAAAVLRGGANAKAVLDVMAESGIKNIKIFHLEENIPHLEEIFLSSVVAPANALFDNVSVIWRKDASIYELLKNIGNDYSMLFLGAPLTFSEILPFYNNIKKCYQGSITIVRGQEQDIDYDESDEIYKWVCKRTYDAEDFSIPAALKSYKKKLGKKAAVVLPTLNEEKTVGNVIEAALEVKDIGLVDEVILVDSLSADNTVEIAKQYGIPVYIHQEVRPELGSLRGKGEAMYKSAFITDADIIAWVDTDIETITPGFFYGLLGPMYTDPKIKFSKGYFTRPVKVEASGVELGGGRVTEILARPWINTYMPELSGFIQPLSGTVAIYRDIFYKMRIPINYGVEMAMLLQAVKQEGLWSTCQVNLGTVVHRSKDVIGLSEMAFQILQVLAEMEQGCKAGQRNELLRRVYSANGYFEIGAKRFDVVWRDYEV
ncbi:MAG: glucosyl-3-phosphoglycerate synthase [Clostridiaceae bacterium]|nr:glucosyl-3-phosphoglycerate synthase [Clostridiaceae bacterium]